MRNNTLFFLVIVFILQTSCNTAKDEKIDQPSDKKIHTGSKVIDNAKKDCITPVLTATINGNHYFKSCDADAHIILSNLNFLGTSDRDIIGFNIATSLNGVTPGTYKINNGAKKPGGQAFAINGLFYLNGDMPIDRHGSIDGTMTFTIADGKRFKGTFEMTCQQKDTKEILKITDGVFDLMYNEKDDLKKLK